VCQDCIVKIYTRAFLADFVTHGQFGYEPASPAAYLCCRHCDYDRSKDDRKPFSFLKKRQRQFKRGRNSLSERDLDTVIKQMVELSKCKSKAAKDRFSKKTGVTVCDRQSNLSSPSPLPTSSPPPLTSR
jgi:hypothetical protein